MIYRFGDCVLNTKLCTLERGGQTFRLRLKVFRMCLYLLEHRDRVVSREELCVQVWPGQFVSQATLEGVIRLVRQVVGDSGRTQGIIQTLHGHGYRFVAPVEESVLPDTIAAAARTVPLPSTVGVSELPEPTKDLTEYRAGPEQDTTLSGVLPEDQWRDSPVASAAGAESLAVSFGKWRNGQPHGGWRWWLPRLGLSLSIITLLVLGGWVVSWAVRAHAAGAYDKSRLAVLPFIDLSGEGDQGHLADGLSENLIAELARIQGLTVIARTSVLKYKGSLKDVATIGHELRVGTIVEGSIRRIDNRVRINAQLIDVASQGHRWSQEYDLDLPEVYGIHSDIANRVAQWLNVQVNTARFNDCLRAEPQSTAMVQKRPRSK